jgi:peptidoglycan hydrolase CwlO-like protein
MPTLKREIILAAIAGFEEQKAKLNSQISELRDMLNGSPASPDTADEAPIPKRRKMSAAARRRIAQAQKARWAKIREESEPTTRATPERSKAKRRISPEGLKRIIAATKKRWRLQKAAGKVARKGR